MNDEVRVLVGTIAFGLGSTNRPCAPSSTPRCRNPSEQFLPGAGRAGRDGLPADCALLWQPKDAGLLAYFIEKLEDRDEKERAWQRYHAVRRFVESARCRHLQICTHFGQTPKWQRCEMCDVCGNIPEWLTAPSEELLAAVKKGSASRRRRHGLHAAARATHATAGHAARATHAAAGRAAHTAAARAARATARATGSVGAGQARPAAPKAPTATWSSSSRNGAGARLSAPPFRPILCSATPRSRISAASNLRISASCWPSPGSASVRRNCTEARSSPHSRLTATGPAPLPPRCRRFRPPKRPCACWRRARASKRSRGFAAASFQTVINMVATWSKKDGWSIPGVGGRSQSPQIEEVVRRLGSQWLKPLREALPPEITYEQIRLVVAFVRREDSPKQQNKHSYVSLNVMLAYANLEAWAKSNTPIK